MAQKKAGFVTGANAKIKIFGKTIAYAGDVAYNVSVQHIPVEAMGRYEVLSNEPVSYTVGGSMSIIRYTARAYASSIDDVTQVGNAPEKVGGGGMQEHFNPKQLLQSQTFDLQIIEKGLPDDAGDPSETTIYTVKDCRFQSRSMTLNKRGIMVDRYAFVGILATDEDIAVTDKTAESGDQDLS